jgi:hypothetical protein
MSTISTLVSFTAGTRAKAAEVNANFTAIRDVVNTYGVLIDVPRTITAVQTFSLAPVFQAGISLTGTLTMATAVSKLVPGATSFSIRNNADSADNLILTDAGNGTVRGTLTVTGTITGTLATAAQANITSLGALTALTIAGNLTFSGASRLIVPGTTALTIRNVGDSANAINITSTTAQIGGTGINALLGVASLATSATSGFPVISATTGTPTGVATQGALVLDSANNKMWVSYGSGTWKFWALS